MRKCLLGLALIAVLVQSVLAFRPAGWVYSNYPWAYDSGSGDWYWFRTADTQWVVNIGSGEWSKLPQSAIASGWVYYANRYAYAHGNGAWHYINAADWQWMVNMRTGVWSRFCESSGSNLDVKLYNAGSSPWVSAIEEDSSGNILISGDEDRVNLFALKIDSSGNQVWNKYYPSGSILARADGIFAETEGYMIVGSVNNTGGSLFKMKLDNDGNAASATYHDPCGGGVDYASGSRDALKLGDGTVVYVGFTDYEYSDGGWNFIPYGDALMTGITSAGVQAYRSSYNYASGHSECFNAVASITGGGIAAAGYTKVYDDGSGYSGPKQALLVKYSGGIVSWVKNYGYHTADGGNNGVVDLAATADGGFALLRWSGYGYQMYVQKVASDGTEEWSANVGGTAGCIGRQIVESPEGNLVIVGSGGENAGAVIKINGSTGAKIWEYYNADHGPTAIFKISSGGYIAAGSVRSDSSYKIFVFKLDESGSRVW